MNRRNVLIQVAEDCPENKGTKPISERMHGTISCIQFEELSKNAYKYNEEEFQKQVHHIRRGKTELNITKYDIRRSELCKKWGWGIHINEESKLALAGCETERYKELNDDPLVQKLGAYKAHKT